MSVRLRPTTAACVLLAIFIGVYVGSVFHTYVAPMTRAGTETYDYYTASRNLIEGNARSIAFLFDYRTNPPGTPLPYEHAPSSHRLLGASLYALGFHRNTDLLVLVSIAFGSFFCGLVWLWSKEVRNSFLLCVAFSLYLLANQYSLVKFLNPLRSIQFGFFAMTLYLIWLNSRGAARKPNQLIIGLAFFLIWQTELIFALFLSMTYAIALLLLSTKEDLPESVRRIVPAVVGSGLSLGLFIGQLFAFRGWAFIDDWRDVVKVRNSTLYTWLTPQDAPLSNLTLLSMFSDIEQAVRYEVPKGIFDFGRHLGLMVWARFNEPAYLIPIFSFLAVVIAGIVAIESWLPKTAVQYRKGVREENRDVRLAGAAIIASLISLFLIAVPFRGYVSFLYLMLFEPLVDMIIALILAFLTLCLAYVLRGFKIGRVVEPFVTSLVAVLFIAASYWTSFSRNEARISVAVPVSTEMLRVLGGKDFAGQRVAANMEELYVLAGLLGLPPVKLPLQLATEAWARPSTIRYYVCSVEMARDKQETIKSWGRLNDLVVGGRSEIKTCDQAMKSLVSEGAKLIYYDNSGFIVDWSTIHSAN